MAKETLLYTIRISATEENGEPAILTEVEGTDAVQALMDNFEDFATVNGIFREDMNETVGNLMYNLVLMQEDIDRKNKAG